jgi:hypothetical protein
MSITMKAVPDKISVNGKARNVRPPKITSPLICRLVLGVNVVIQ